MEIVSWVQVRVRAIQLGGAQMVAAEGVWDISLMWQESVSWNIECAKWAGVSFGPDRIGRRWVRGERRARSLSRVD